MSRLPYLLPWVRVLLLIRSITSTTWGHEAGGEAAAAARIGDAPADRQGGLVELNAVTAFWWFVPLSRRAAILLGALAILVLISLGCATTSSPPKTVTDLKQLVGSWDGWIGCHGCSPRFRASLLVRDDGYWKMTVERNAIRHGRFGIVNGVLQWGDDSRWVGPVIVVEERGREYMTLRRANGETWTEFDRAK